MNAMEERINVLREGRAASDVVTASLAADVKALTEAVAKLQSSIDTSRGALWVISGVSGVAGAISALVATFWYHKGV